MRGFFKILRITWLLPVCFAAISCTGTEDLTLIEDEDPPAPAPPIFQLPGDLNTDTSDNPLIAGVWEHTVAYDDGYQNKTKFRIQFSRRNTSWQMKYRPGYNGAGEPLWVDYAEGSVYALQNLMSVHDDTRIDTIADLLIEINWSYGNGTPRTFNPGACIVLKLSDMVWGLSTGVYSSVKMDIPVSIGVGGDKPLNETLGGNWVRAETD